MSTSKQSQEELEADYHAFYELIGHYVTHYQTLEDYLPDVFSAALGGSSERNKAMFAAVRGIDAKLALIDGALTEADQTRRDQWRRLRAQIAAVQETRGDLAHSSPTTAGSLTIIKGEPGSRTHVSHGEQWMEARKRTRKGERAWKVKELKDDLKHLRMVWQAAIAFVSLLEGRQPQEHLLRSLEEVAS